MIVGTWIGFLAAALCNSAKRCEAEGSVDYES
jgi:hypothetical protein